MAQQKNATLVACAVLVSIAVLSPTFLIPTAQKLTPGRLEVLPAEQSLDGVEELKTAGSSGVAQMAGVSLALAGMVALAASRKGSPVSKHAVTMQAFENELGVQGPVGFWDPVGFTADGDVAAFKRRRSVELKHGRISMLACMGYLTPELTGKFPGYLSPSADLKFTDIPNGLGAISKVPVAGWAQIVAWFGATEFLGGFEDYKTGTPGDYGWKALTSSDPAEKTRKLQSELANSRLAMTAIMSMLFQNGIVGNTGPEMWMGVRGTATDTSSTTKPISEMKWLQGTGGPTPNDFFDPLGFSKGASEETMLQYRAAEIKHGRVAMLAIIGWCHVAAGYHPIGDFANDVRGSNDPLIALQQTPMGGLWQVLFTLMCFEWLFKYPCPPPKEAPWDLWGMSDIMTGMNANEAKRWKEQQLRELNNGRLAMFGIIGLIAQDALTGEYGAGIGQACFGNPVCADGNFRTIFPKVPFVMPPLYPGQPVPVFPPVLPGVESGDIFPLVGTTYAKVSSIAPGL